MVDLTGGLDNDVSSDDDEEEDERDTLLYTLATNDIATGKSNLTIKTVVAPVPGSLVPVRFDPMSGSTSAAPSSAALPPVYT